MTRKNILHSLLFITLSFFAVHSRAADEKVVPEDKYGLPFPVGESLTFDIKWGWISVAKSVATTEWVEEEGRELIKIQFRTKSNSYLKKIYPVNDTIVSIIDPATLLPIRFTKVLNEGRYSTNELTDFDFEAGTASWTKFRDSGNKTKTYAIDENTRDLVSFMYAMRRHDFEENSEYEERVMADEKVYDLMVKTGAIKKRKVGKFGKVKCLKLDPEAAFEGLFVRKGKMSMWMSTEDRQIFTYIEVDTPFANVHLHLVDVEGGPKDRWTKDDKDPDAVEKLFTDDEMSAPIKARSKS